MPEISNLFKGFHGLPLEDSETSTPALYRFFPSKMLVYREVPPDLDGGSRDNQPSLTSNSAHLSFPRTCIFI